MQIEPIHGYCLDLKQDFPKDLRIAQQECKSLKHTNDVLTAALIIVGIGLSVAYIYGQLAERETRQESN